MKKKIYFILQPLFILKILNFCPNFSGHVGKQLDKKKVNFEIYDVITEKQTIAINILLNI